MEAKDLGYSLKNIPTPTKQHYLKSMIDKAESFITRLRWKAYFFEKPDQHNSNNSTNFGFKSNVTPPQNEKRTSFEDGLYDMMRSIEFKPVRNNFQSTLREDINRTKSSRHSLVFADKATNLYEMPPDQYKTLLNNNVTKTYRKANSNAKRNIDKEAKKLSKELNLEDKMECYAKRPAFITLKDHKENFKSNQKCRLSNPCKSEMGIVSKKYLENIISKLNSKLQYNQRRNTSTVIEWFKAIKNKAKCRFIKFDIAEFYPSISIELLDRSISFAKSLIDIEGNIINTITHAGKSLLFNDSGACI